MSVVGFVFRGTRVRGVPVPWHRTFEEINLRFYVRRRSVEGWRRAVVFVKELVPRRLIAFVARRLYNENYVAVSMGLRQTHDSETTAGSTIAYWWRSKGSEGQLSLTTVGGSTPLVEDSEEEFLAEHYWGYTRQRDGGTLEYRVAHPRWRIVRSNWAQLQGDVRSLYGPALAEGLSGKPASAFLAEGSPVEVYVGRRLALP